MEELEKVLAFIDEAGEKELNIIIQTISDRYRDAFPHWEVIYMAVPTMTEEDRVRFCREATDLISRFTS